MIGHRINNKCLSTTTLNSCPISGQFGVFFRCLVLIINNNCGFEFPVTLKELFNFFFFFRVR